MHDVSPASLIVPFSDKRVPLNPDVGVAPGNDSDQGLPIDCNSSFTFVGGLKLQGSMASAEAAEEVLDHGFSLDGFVRLVGVDINWFLSSVLCRHSPLDFWELRTCWTWRLATTYSALNLTTNFCAVACPSTSNQCNICKPRAGNLFLHKASDSSSGNQ